MKIMQLPMIATRVFVYQITVQRQLVNPLEKLAVLFASKMYLLKLLTDGAVQQFLLGGTNHHRCILEELLQLIERSVEPVQWQVFHKHQRFFRVTMGGPSTALLYELLELLWPANSKDLSIVFLAIVVS